MTEDGAYALLLTGELARNGFDVFAPGTPHGPRKTLIAPGGGTVRYAGNQGSRFFFRSETAAPNGALVEVDAADARPIPRTLIAERPDPLTGVSFVGNRFFLVYLHDVHDVVVIANRAGEQVGTLALPGLGTATVPQGNAADGYATYAFSSLTVPWTTYRYDLATGTSAPAGRGAGRFDATPYVTEQLFAASRDGARVPLFIVHRRDLRYDGSTPLLLTGYGAFGDSLTPVFRESAALWLRMGGAYAIVNARGGGEYGERWHRAGMLENKQHTFDDAIAAAETLEGRRMTSPRKLAVYGASGGGLMAAAVVTQRPELFGAAVVEAAPLDMLRYPRFTVGAAWIPENGSADQSEAMFRTLLAYSPLHNVRPGTRYPAILVTTGDHDDRVFPAHSYKFAAALQRAQAGDAPVLLRVAENTGHQSGVAGSFADDVADRYAFLVKNLGFDPGL